MAIGLKSYYKPVDFIDVIRDNQGRPLPQNVQWDLYEFNDIMLSRISEAIDSEIEGLSLTKHPDIPAPVNLLDKLIDGETCEVRSYTDLRTGRNVQKLDTQKFFNLNLSLVN